jgi:hypothetical protein
VVAEKEILSPSAALNRVANTGDAKGTVSGAGSKGAPLTPQFKFHFVKLFGVGDQIKFEDGTTFKFRLIERNNGAGYAPNSFVKTNDEMLADNLREAARNKALGIREIK